MRIYISGPMTGKPDLNEPLFRNTEHRLRELGHEVFQSMHTLSQALSYRDAMKYRCGVDMQATLTRFSCCPDGWTRPAPRRKSRLPICHRTYRIYEAVAAGFYRRHVWIAIVDEPHDRRNAWRR